MKGSSKEWLRMLPRRALGIVALTVSVTSILVASPIPAQRESDSRVSSVEQRVSTLERRIRSIEEEAAAGGLVLILFGAFCALWAQSTRRSAWLWFFLGMLFNVFTVIVLLYKNSHDSEQGEGVS